GPDRSEDFDDVAHGAGHLESSRAEGVRLNDGMDSPSDWKGIGSSRVVEVIGAVSMKGGVRGQAYVDHGGPGKVRSRSRGCGPAGACRRGAAPAPPSRPDLGCREVAAVWAQPLPGSYGCIKHPSRCDRRGPA